MSATEIREALTAVRDATDVPPIDRLALERRVRSERRRRTAGRGVAAIVGLAAASVAVAGVVAVTGDPTPPTTVAAATVANPEELVGFVVEGRLVVGGPDGYHETDVPARNVLGITDGLLVLADTKGAVVGVPVDADGTPGRARRLLPGVVDYVWLDGSDGTVYVVDHHGRLRSWTPEDQVWTSLSASRSVLYLVDTGHRVESGPNGVTLVADGLRKALPSGGGIRGGGLAGSVLAWETVRHLRFYDADTGRRLTRIPGEWSGALSADGTSYAGSHDGGVDVVDPRTGAVASVRGPDSLAGVTWTADDTFVGTERTEAGVTLWECRVDALSCTRLYVDSSDTLQLHS